MFISSRLEVANMPQCSTCGSSVSAQDRVCPDCGMELGPVVPSAGAQTPAATPPASPAAVPPSSLQPSAAPPASPVPPAQPVAGLARLTLRRAGALTSESFPLGEHVTIGRFDVETGPVDVDLGPLPEGAYLSRHHAEVWRDTEWEMVHQGPRFAEWNLGAASFVNAIPAGRPRTARK